jgi:hypothetical protein
LALFDALSVGYHLMMRPAQNLLHDIVCFSAQVF